MNIIFIKKKWFYFLGLCLMIAAASSYIFMDRSAPVNGAVQTAKELEINLVTGEFKTKTKDGKEIEAYRWDPGTIYIPEGEKVKLSIYGVNGEEHPFIIEGTEIKGTVEKGKETVVDLYFEEEGIYRLICLKHPDIQNNGPMIAYIVVD